MKAFSIVFLYLGLASAIAQASQKKLDVLFIIDNSSSMKYYQDRLANEMPMFIEYLSISNTDFHIAAVTTDMRQSGDGGKLVGNPAVLTSYTENPSSLLKGRVLQGSRGSDLERGIKSTMKALDNDTVFLRPDAFLAVIAISSEDDYSEASLNNFSTFLNSIKGPGKWDVSIIGVHQDDTRCYTSPDGIYKEPSTKYLDLASLTSGVVGSICDKSYSQTVKNILKNIFSKI